MAFIGGLAGIGKVVGAVGTAVSVASSFSAASAQKRSYEYNQIVAQRNATNQRATAQFDFILKQHETTMQRATANAQLAFEENQLAWQRYDYEQQTRIHDENARRQEIEAEQAAQRTNEQIERQQRENEKILALQRARAGASGVRGPIAVLGQEAVENQFLELQDILYQGNLERHGHLEQARIDKWRSRLAKEQGELADTTGQFQANLNFAVATMRLDLEESANQVQLDQRIRQADLAEYSALSRPDTSGATRLQGIGQGISGISGLLSNQGRDSTPDVTNVYYNADLTQPFATNF